MALFEAKCALIRGETDTSKLVFFFCSFANAAEKEINKLDFFFPRTYKSRAHWIRITPENSTATIERSKTNAMYSSRTKMLIYAMLYDGICSAVLGYQLKIRPV